MKFKNWFVWEILFCIAFSSYLGYATIIYGSLVLMWFSGLFAACGIILFQHYLQNEKDYELIDELGDDDF